MSTRRRFSMVPRRLLFCGRLRTLKLWYRSADTSYQQVVPKMSVRDEPNRFRRVALPPPTPLPGYFKERDRAPQSRGVDRRDASVWGRALVDHVRRRRRVGACALTHRPGASLPVAPRRKPAFSFFSNHDDLALTSPFHLCGFHSTRRVSSRRSSHTQPFGGAGSAPAFGAAPAAGAASVRAKSFFRRPRRFRSGTDTSRSALDIL